VRSDPDLIVLVLQNLVHNAVKYSGRGAIRLGCRRARAPRGERWCVLSVSDEGPGIYQPQLARIFDPFWRGGPTQGRDGAGLGLAIASEAAKALGAELSVESQLGAGSTFYLRLPCPAPSSARPMRHARLSKTNLH
jgi:signal transduction histidine kinase